jgi:hypothetical protein
MKRLPRRQIMIDQEVQGALVFRVVWYWVGCEATVLLLHVVWQLGNGPERDPVRIATREVCHLLPALLGTLLVQPLVITDVLRLSNRFVGPIGNLRNALKRSELGDAVAPLQRRPADFWPDLLDRVNRLLQRPGACGVAEPGAARDHRAPGQAAGDDPA